MLQYPADQIQIISSHEHMDVLYSITSIMLYKYQCEYNYGHSITKILYKSIDWCIQKTTACFNTLLIQLQTIYEKIQKEKLHCVVFRKIQHELCPCTHHYSLQVPSFLEMVKLIHSQCFEHCQYSKYNFFYLVTVLQNMIEPRYHCTNQTSVVLHMIVFYYVKPSPFEVRNKHYIADSNPVWTIPFLIVMQVAGPNMHITCIM